MAGSNRLYVVGALTVLGMLVASELLAQEATRSSDDVWELVDERSITSTGERVTVPRAYRTVRLNKDALDVLLLRAPMEFSGARGADVVLSLPMPDGSFSAFQIEESPILQPALAAQVPEIKTYRGQGVDDPTVTTRFGWTANGFHAIILGPDTTVYVDPFARGDLTNYITYYKQDIAPRDGRLCLVGGDTQRGLLVFNALPISQGTTLRTYDLALAATGEYTAAVGGGTKVGALAAMTTTMNRVNGIYEKNLAVRMTLVGNNMNIIYTNGGSDPYTNNTGFLMLAENQLNLDAVIGSANYDIGHVFSTGGGGVATLRSPCLGGSKARGVTGLMNPTGDVFDVDFVAHEMGHQFGGNHPFNGTTSACGGNRSASHAYEPGSGSTIMAYAGICAEENLQPNSDDYFHIESLNEMTSFINDGMTGGSCPTANATGNTVPTVNAGADYTVPMGTPFELTASGNDGNGDALTYGWEQYDLGAAAPPNTDDLASRPIFRSLSPVTGSHRTFPSLTYVLNNANAPPATYTCGASTCLTGESLPTRTRSMNFQVTARDNRANGGGVVSDSMVVSVQAGSGPFLVTSQNTARPALGFGEGGADGSGSGDPLTTRLALVGGSSQTVTWNVANTAAAPVSTANVRILLSTDGGTTFPTTLLASTPNDGSASVVIPNTATTTARLKVQPVGNIFFDISNVDFTITVMVVAWTDDPLVGGTTQVKAIHFTEMRNRVNVLRASRMLSTFVFTDPTLTAQTTVVSATHLNQVREALAGVYTKDGVTLPTYTNTIATGSTILALDIKETRDAVVARGG